jgi:hypothetical protein
MRYLCCAFASLILVVSPVRAAGVEAQARYVSVRVLSPPDGFISMQASSGWPLTIRLISKGELGISIVTYPHRGDVFPSAGMTALLLYSDPDHCPSWAGNNDIDESVFRDCVRPRPWPFDETSLRFSLDADCPGSRDAVGEPTAASGGGPPKIVIFDELTRTPSLAPIGPATGESGNEPDGYGYGPDDDLLGLVILSDTGPGVVFDQFFNLPTPRQARNLAGFVNTVSYELDDASRHTSVTAHMAVPEGLFNPVVLLDSCVTNSRGELCGGGSLYRVDGAPLGQPSPSATTVRIFVVNGTAPALIADADGDGVVGAQDAQLAGYTLISREETVRLRQAPALFPFDFDRNGRALGPQEAPGPLTLTRVPR